MKKTAFAAIDVGTTTVAVSLIDENGHIIAKSGLLNPQHVFGSDVISRITLSERKNNLARMYEMIIESISGELLRLSEENEAEVVCGIISANTTMASIILDRSIDSLGRAPFECPYDENLTIKLLDGRPFTVIAGTSAFIGADACIGAYTLFGNSSDKNVVMMDLGTNGEMILKKNDELFAVSAACGPAFENSTRASGIYGKTTLSAIAYLIKRGELSRELLLTEDFIENGRDVCISGTRIHLTEKIIRSIQLAVAAIYSSLIFLIRSAGLKTEDIERLYISGGFGFHMSLSDAVTLGMIPESLLDRTVVSGNTSLSGAEELLRNDKILLDKAYTGGELPEEVFKEYNIFRKSIKTLAAGGNSEYEELYLKSMTFNKR